MGAYKVYANYPTSERRPDEFIAGKTVHAASPADAALTRLNHYTIADDQENVARVLVISEGNYENPRVFNVERVTKPSFKVTPG